MNENPAFPADDPRKPEEGKLAVYLRIEGNYIETSAIQDLGKISVKIAMSIVSRCVQSHLILFLVLLAAVFLFRQKPRARFLRWTLSIRDRRVWMMASPRQ